MLSLVEKKDSRQESREGVRMEKKAMKESGPEFKIMIEQTMCTHAGVTLMI